MKKLFLNLLPYIIIIVVVVLLRVFIVTLVRVNGTSMNPTLEDKEVILLVKATKYFKDYDRFQIVVVKEGNSYIIKRIIGLPGETIECIDGLIYIDGKLLEDLYGDGITSNFTEVNLDNDEYFVMGDNREVSQDSRVIGPVKKSTIKGYAYLIVYPFNEFGKTK